MIGVGLQEEKKEEAALRQTFSSQLQFTPLQNLSTILNETMSSVDITGDNVESNPVDDDYDKFDAMQQYQDKLIVDGFFLALDIERSLWIPAEIQRLCFNYYNIQSMRVLEVRRTVELYNTLEIERLMVHKACTTKFHRFHEKILKNVITEWNAKANGVTYRRSWIIEIVQQCIARDNAQILRSILECGGYDEKSLEDAMFTIEECQQDMMTFINFAAVCNAPRCLKLLLEAPDKLNWTEHLRPMPLLNAIRFNHKDADFIHLIIDRLKMAKVNFICDEIMQEIICFGLVSVGRRIVELKWHRISADDRWLAAELDGECNAWLNARDLFYGDFDNNDNCIELDDSEWESDDDGDQLMADE